MARKPTIMGDGSPEEDDEQSIRDSLPKAKDFMVDDQQLDDELRPQRLDQIIGQRKVIERVGIILDAAKMRDEALGHLLLDGPPGLGKTTIAMLVPRELGSEIQITSGPVLKAPKDLIPYLTRASEKSVLFIDEIHRLSPAVEEYLYPAMEDFRLDIAIGEGLNARTINMQLKPFTVIGATTRSGMLTAPLRDRFVNRAHLDFYEAEELQQIVIRNATKLKMDLSDDAATEVAGRSRGTPRKANNLLRWIRDFAQVKSVSLDAISHQVTLDALSMLEIDPLGLEDLDRRYLTTLSKVFGGGPAGIQSIGHSMNLAADTLEDEVEPFLLRLGFLQRTPRGRMITASACDHLGLPKPVKQGSGEGLL